MDALLTEKEQKLLKNLHAADPKAEYAINLLNPDLTKGIETQEKQQVDDVLASLNGLAKKKYIGAEGRGPLRGFWIEDKGRKAIDAEGTD